MVFEFEKNNERWGHEGKFYSSEDLLEHYKEFHPEDVTSFTMFPNEMKDYTKMSKILNDARVEWKKHQKDRRKFFERDY